MTSYELPHERRPSRPPARRGDDALWLLLLLGLLSLLAVAAIVLLGA